MVTDIRYLTSCGLDYGPQTGFLDLHIKWQLIMIYMALDYFEGCGTQDRWPDDPSEGCLVSWIFCGHGYSYRTRGVMDSCGRVSF